PVTVANSLLQAKFEGAATAMGRFVVNTTIGVVGIFDVATDWGMPGRNRDFGETMGTYGVPPGPYLVLPFRGSTDVRDFAGNNIVTFRDIQRTSVDYYATMRTLYMERRARLIEDKPIRTAELPDF